MNTIEQEMASLLPETRLGQHLAQQSTRRGFIGTTLGTTLAAGFAVAVLPASAQTIVTDAEGLDAGTVEIPVEGGAMRAYRARPAGKSNLATVLVVQEIFGVHEHIQDLCRRLARQGYLAIAPDLYHRYGDATKEASIADIIARIVDKVPDDEVLRDLDAAAGWAAKNGGHAGKLAITGFCWGGRITWLYAAHSSKVKAGVAWYGRLTSEINPRTPRHPIDVARELKAPVLGLYGGEDTGIPMPTVARMQDALKSASPKSPAAVSDFAVYRDAPHGFNADYRPTYRKDVAEDAWARMLAWFRRHGVS